MAYNVRVPDNFQSAYNVRVPDNFAGNYSVRSPAPFATGAVSIDMTLAPDGASWVIVPDIGGVSSGSNSRDFADAPTGDYTLTWQDTAFDSFNPSPVDGPKTLADGGAISFLLSDNPYQQRLSATFNVDITIFGGGPAVEADALWTLQADAPFQSEYTLNGNGDQTVSANIWDGRSYTITFQPIAGYSTPPPITTTATGVQTLAGNYTLL